MRRAKPKTERTREELDFQTLTAKITPEQRRLMRKYATPWRDAGARSRGDPLPEECLAPPVHRTERHAGVDGRLIERRW